MTEKPKKLFVKCSEVKNCIWIEDEDGTQVCDFYYVDTVTRKLHQFQDAEKHAEEFVELWNNKYFGIYS